MTIERLPEKALFGNQIALFTEEKLDHVAQAVDGAIEIHRLAANPDVGLVHMPPGGHGALAQVEALQQLWRIPDNPTMDRGVIDTDAPFGHHFSQVSQAQAVAEIPAHAKQDDRLIEMLPLTIELPRETAEDHRQTKGTQIFATEPESLGPHGRQCYYDDANV